MKILVVYFSKTGNTGKIAEELSKKLGADLDEIKEVEKRGFIGTWLGGTRQAMKGVASEIESLKNPADYDLVVLGGPVWAWNLVPPLRGYLEKHKDKIEKLAFFLTYGGNDGKNLEEVSKIKEPIAFMKILDKKVKAGDYNEEIDTFCNQIKGK